MEEIVEDKSKVIENLYCLFCYKAYPSQQDESNESFKRNNNTTENLQYRAQLCNNFYSALEKSSSLRIAKQFSSEQSTLKQNKLASSQVHSVCNDCATLIKKYNELFGEMECLRMKLRWQIMQIHDVMKFARKVPQRVQEFEEKLKSKPDLEGQEDFYVMINDFRKNVYRSCGDILNVKCPRVRLRRLKKVQLPPHKQRQSETSDSLVCKSVSNPNSAIKSPAKLSPTSANFFPPTETEPDDNSTKKIAAGILTQTQRHDSDAVADKSGESCTNKISRSQGALLNEKEMDVEKPVEDTTEELKDSECDIAQNTINSNETVPVISNETNNVNQDSKELESLDQKTDLAEDSTPAEVDKSSPIIMESEESTALPSKISNNNCKEHGEKSPHSHRPRKRKETEDKAEPKLSRSHPVRVHEKSKHKSKDNRLKTTKQAEPVKVCPFDTCKERFYSEGELEVHLRFHGSFPCNFCEFVGERVDGLVEHEFSSHHPHHDTCKNVSHCPRCDYKVKENAKRCHKILVFHYLKSHLRISYHIGSHSNAQIKCSVCGRCFDEPGDMKIELQRHIKAQHDIDGKSENLIFRCDKCNAPFLTDLQRLVHLREDHKVDGFTCSKCYIKFDQKKSYKYHMEKKHSKSK